MMKLHGFGRNGKKKYGEGKAPSWWDEELCAWDGNLNGVHAPKNWKSLNQGSWTKALFELIKCCYLNYMTLDEAEDYIEYRTVENVTDINLEVAYTEEFSPMDLQTDNIIENEENITELTTTNIEASDNTIDHAKKVTSKKKFTQQTIQKCSVCGRMKFTRKLLNEHMLSVHGLDSIMSPPFTKKRQLINEEVEMNSCKFCGKIYKTECWLKKHIEKSHS